MFPVIVGAIDAAEDAPTPPGDTRGAASLECDFQSLASGEGKAATDVAVEVKLGETGLFAEC